MITVPEATEKIVKRSRYLSEALSKDIINISSLARYIKPEIEEMLIKDVSVSSVIMALKRLSGKNFPNTPYEEIFKDSPQISIKTNLYLVASDSKNVIEDYILKTQENGEEVCLTNTKPKKHEYEYPVSSISIPLPKNSIKTPGIYYFFIKSLAWERINILQIFTTSKDFTIVVEESDLNRALDIIRSLFKKDFS